MRARSSRASLSTPLAIVALLLLAPSSLALAQNPATPAARTSPVREGNIYDHIDHQPTRAEVERAEAAAGAGRPSSATDREVENEVKALLKETDEQDKKSDEDINRPTVER
jgi:hypothetical protein